MDTPYKVEQIVTVTSIHKSKIMLNNVTEENTQRKD